MMNKFFRYLSKFVFFILPETGCFGIKRSLYRLQGYKIGTKTRICSSARIFGSGSVMIGKNVWIGPEVMIVSSSCISIEDNVDIAPRVYIGTGTHEIGNIVGRMAGRGLSMNVIINKGTWIGASTIILPGVTIGEMSVIGAGSIVTHTIPPFSLAVGNPCIVKKKLDVV